jgi:hypothetical protein
MLENTSQANKDMIECPNCHFLLDYDEHLCPECKFVLRIETKLRHKIFDNQKKVVKKCLNVF